MPPEDVEDTTHPYLGVCTIEDLDLLVTVLEGLTQGAEQHGDGATAARLTRLTRTFAQMRQLEAGEPLPPAVVDKGIDVVLNALKKQDHPQLVGALRQLYAMLARVERDPAQALALALTRVSLTALQQQTEATADAVAYACLAYGERTLKRIDLKVTALLGRSAKWPASWTQETHGAWHALKFMQQWLRHGIEHMSPEHEPWSGDPDLAEGGE